VVAPLGGRGGRGRRARGAGPTGMKSSRPLAAAGAPTNGAGAPALRIGGDWVTSVTAAASQHPRISSPLSGSRRGSSPQ
jgi:hypothetical protein